MADYVSLALVVFIINVIPAFMPPTWAVLAIAKVNDPSLDLFMITLVGAVSSTAGRAALAFCSSFFRSFFTREIGRRADEIHRFFEKRGNELFIGTFIYSLSPFPSNLVFIAKGLTQTDWKPVFSGFFIGRLISYFVLVALSQDIYVLLADYFKSEAYVRYLLDALGVLAAFSVLLVDWKKIMGGKNDKQKGERSKKSA